MSAGVQPNLEVLPVVGEMLDSSRIPRSYLLSHLVLPFLSIRELSINRATVN